MNEPLRIAIIGCGAVGRKRAASMKGNSIVTVADSDPQRAAELAAVVGCHSSGAEWLQAIKRSDVQSVIVATSHASLAPVALAAVQAGKHVLIEKPGARRTGELEPIARASRERGVCVKVGYNHRFHPAVQKARTIIDRGELGPLYFIRGRYGHGGRMGYDREWRANREISGGGELLDQGVHLIDLSRWFLGEFSSVEGWIPTYYWDMEVEDNAFLMLDTAAGQKAWLHASWTEWKNLFSLEVYGQKGKLHLEGLGGSYGTERLAYYRMLPEMGPPETTIFEYPGEDRSWKLEFQDFQEAIRTGREPCGSLQDAMAVLRIVEKIYA